MRSEILSTLLISTILFWGCDKKENTQAQIISEEITQYPVSLDLIMSEPLNIKVPSMGMTDFRIVDSLLIVSVNENHNFWHLFSLPDLETKDSIFDVGGGPGEFLMPIPASYLSNVRKNNGTIVIGVPFLEKSKMELFNIKWGEDKIILDRESELNIPVERNSFISYMLGENNVLNLTIKPEEGRIEREIIELESSESAPSENVIIKMLNNRKVEDLSQLPLLMTHPIVKPDGRFVAEIPGIKNEIYLYASDGSICKKIVFPELKKISEEIIRDKDYQKSIFKGGHGYDDFFTIMRYDTSGDREEKYYLDFINWDGKPLGTIQLPEKKIRSCDLSLDNSLLFCLDEEEDEMFSYDISDFIERLNLKPNL